MERLEQAPAYFEQAGLAIHAFLVIEHGRIVFERYPSGADPDKAFPIESMTKSLLSAAIGVALEQGLFPNGLDSRALDLFADHQFADPSDLKDAMDLEDLLTLRSGLDYDNATESFADKDDPEGFILDHPMLAEPGTVWRYSSAEAQLLSAALTRASGQSTRRYVESHVLDPIGAQVHSWAQDASGVEIGGYGVEMTARDLARFGLLYLRQGRWLGAEVVPAEWIAASTTVHAVTPWTRGDFGYLWWVRRDEGYRAGGRYGQQLNVFPDRDLLVIYLAQLPLETADDILDSVTRYYVLGQGNAPVSGDYGYQSECTNTAAKQVTGGTALPQVTSKWAFGDGESTFCPEVDATGRLCFEGVAAAAGSDYSWWGAVLQLQLAAVRDDQIIPFDAAARGIAGVRLRVDSVGALPAGLRLGLSRVDADGIDYQQNPFVRGGGSAGDFHEEGILEASFTEFSRPFWSELPQSATLDPGALFGLNVQVVTTPTSSFGYRVCVSELTWLDGSRSPID